MPLSPAIEQNLKNLTIEYDLQPAQGDNSPGQIGDAKTILLQTASEKLQVIYPADCLLDIDATCRLCNLKLKALTPGDIDNFDKSQHFERLPAVPYALGLEVVIDHRLLEKAALQLDSGCESTLLSFQQAALQQLCSNAMVGNIAINEQSLRHGKLDSSKDIDQINSAVANFTQLRIKQQLEETLEFPPLPDTAQRIIKLRVNPNADIQDLTDIVEADPALAAQVVSWAASPYYAAPGKIKSVHDAIVRVLGFDLVLNLGLALGKTLNLPKDTARGFTPYWEQAVYAATAVEGLVGAIPPQARPSMDIAYLSGLLHNFGYMILAEVFPPHFSNICRFQEANPYSNHSIIERHLLGVTREQLGSWLMQLWNMPEEVCTALRFQHEPEYQGENASYAALMFVAMRLLRQHGIGDGPLEAIPQQVFKHLQLDPDKASEVIATVVNASEELNLIAREMAA